jgi:hypothetical protein
MFLNQDVDHIPALIHGAIDTVARPRSSRRPRPGARCHPAAVAGARVSERTRVRIFGTTAGWSRR